MKRVIYALILVVVMTLLGGFSGHLLAGLTGNDTSSVTVTVVARPIYSSQWGDEDGGDGDVADGDEEDECPAGSVYTTGMVTDECIAIQPIIIASFDKRLYLTIDEGTSILTPDGTCPRCIGIYEVATLPPQPEEACIIGCMYDAFPDGAIFDPPATLQASYDPNDLPEGIVAGECLSVACYDPINYEWIKQCCVFDTEASTITAEVSQFYDFAILGYELATFEVVSLHIYPTEVEIGETVNITVLVANIGGQPGSYQLTLKIDNVSETDGEAAAVAAAEREVVINASASEQVSFTTSKDTPGLYLVEVNGLTGSFEVKPPPLSPPVEPVNWWLIGGIIAAVAIVVFVTPLFLLRRR